MKKRILAAVMAAAMLTLGMAGCGSANNSNSENNETATTAASSIRATPSRHWSI